MSDGTAGNSAYEDIGPVLKEAGWRLTDVSVADEDVTLTYEREVDGQVMDSIVSTHESGSMARYAAVRRMHESSFDQRS